MSYVHVDINVCQSPKQPASPCGDVVEYQRTPMATTIACCDGLGSGIKANIAATLCASRLFELTRRGYTLREAFACLVETMNEARLTDMPFSALTVARIHTDGETTVLSYEMPAPVFVGLRKSCVLQMRPLNHRQALMNESNCYLAPGEGLVIVSDGITHAGLGNGLAEGWTIEGVSHWLDSSLQSRSNLADLPFQMSRHAARLWGPRLGDDCTSVVAACRAGETVNILTGPPLNRSQDAALASEFVHMDGRKVICGATTAKVVSRYLGKSISVEQDTRSAIAPPRYQLDGIDLVTEGAVSLNQVYNILEEDPEAYEPGTGVSELGRLLMKADRIQFIVGRAPNIGHGDIQFRQQGIIPREAIIPLIKGKLERRGKLVVIRYV